MVKKKILHELRALHLIMEQVADDKYLVPGESYNRSANKLAGHCGVVAWLVQKRYGGQMVFTYIMIPPDYHHVEQHIWNRLPDGTEVDLTSDQFEGDGVHPRAAWEGKGKLAKLSPAGLTRAHAFEKAVKEAEK